MEVTLKMINILSNSITMQPTNNWLQWYVGMYFTSDMVLFIHNLQQLMTVKLQDYNRSSKKDLLL